LLFVTKLIGHLFEPGRSNELPACSALLLLFYTNLQEQFLQAKK